jgi:ATP-dependent DNA helicase PIF1
MKMILVLFINYQYNSTPPKPNQQHYMLSEEQQNAFNKFIQGKNVFITGPAGTGKSLLINNIYEYSAERNLRIQICALTGTASILLKKCKSKTIHSFSGIGLGIGTIESNIQKIKKSWFKTKIWRETRILVVDEVSMMSKKIFEMLDAIGKSVRNNQRPFGGIQVVFLGDFYQLPPIESRDEPESGMFCFESDLWFQTFFRENHIILRKIFRQTDETYIRILNEIRIQKIQPESIEILRKLVGRKIEDGVVVTNIYPKKNMVETVNNREMNKLETDEIEYGMKFMSVIPKTSNITPQQIQIETNYLKSNLLCDESLTLKIGSQVMCIVNLVENEICNGSQGIVIDFSTDHFPIVKFNNGITKKIGFHKWESESIVGVSVIQIPLILAWALSVHKIQGCSLDNAKIDVGSNIFEFAQTYVALSRVRSLHGLYLSAFDESKIRVNPKVVEFYSQIDSN